MAPDGAKCAHCGASVPASDGIFDFVGTSASTQLDNIDYDQFYNIDEDHSRNLYQLVKHSAGALWSADFGDALEIGCGTGGLSLALLRNISARHIVLTDVSTKMLRLCRERLRRANVLRDGAITFATYSGTEECFRPDAFDTCFGTAVAHHILDIPRFLAHVHAFLKPGGKAFFMEPNLEFHSALTATMADIIAESLGSGSIPEKDISLMLNWTSEVRCNIANRHDLEVLAEREDKHLFVPEEFRESAKTAGFARALALPCNSDPTGWDSICVYLRQGGVSSETFATLHRRWSLAYARHFRRLGPRDQSPSYLFWLQKGTRKRRQPTGITQRPAVASTSPQSADGIASHQLKTELWLTLGIQRLEQDLELAVVGWCLAGETAGSVRITVLGTGYRVPIWRPRPDVQTAMNANNAYPPLNALCSGVVSNVRLRDRTLDHSVNVAVQVVATDGRCLLERTATLVVGGESVLIT